MTIVVGAITRAGGDVDKLIGDAVLARFQGARAEVRALGAAREALRLLDQAELPRGIGIGIYTGEVISGTVGSADRMDFTVIGDSVNLAPEYLCHTGRPTRHEHALPLLRAAGHLGPRLLPPVRGIPALGRDGGTPSPRARRADASRCRRWRARPRRCS